MDRGLATLAALALWLVPVVVWEAPRDLSHSILAATLAPPTLLLLIRLAEAPAAWRYAALGATLGLGILAKYNFALLAAVLLGAALSVPRFRRGLLDRRIGLTLLVAGAIAGPHLAWLAMDPTSPAPTARLRIGQWSGDGPAGLARPLGEAFVDLIAFLGPLCLVVGALVPAIRRPLADSDARRRAARQLLERYFLALSAILVFSAPLAGLAAFKARWLLPLLVVAPVAVFLRVGPGGIAPAVRRRLIRVCVTAGVIALGLRLGEVAVGPTLGHSSRLHLPVAELAARIRAVGFRQGTIVAGDVPLAGNLRLQFPASVVLTPAVAPHGVAPREGPGQCMVAWRPRRAAAVPGTILAFASQALGQPPLRADRAWLLEVPLRPPAVGAYGLHVLPVAPGPPPCVRAVGVAAVDAE